MSKEEETRIAREAMDQQGFLPRLERLLLAVDDSAVGRTAARLAGLLAGAQGMPVTILKLNADLRHAGRRQAEEAGARTAKPEPRHIEQTDANGHRAEGSERRAVAAGKRRRSQGRSLAREVKTGAKKSAARVKADEAEPDPEKVHLTARVPVDPPAEVVKDEARKGYDLMFVGLEDSVRRMAALRRS